MALTITSVSSQTDRFSGSMLPFDRAWIIKARLLMLFDAGSFTVASSREGALRIYCMFAFNLYYYANLTKNPE